MRLSGHIPRSTSAISRWAALIVAVAVACVWGQIATVTHLETTRHITCAEHGEIMDAPVEGAHEAEPLSLTPTIHRGADPLHGRNHEHCVFALHARQCAAQVTPSAISAHVLAVEERVAPPIATGASTPLVTLYRLAPKTSRPV